MASIETSRKVKSFTDISLSFEPNPVTGDLTVLKNERAINNAIKNIILFVPLDVPFARNVGSMVSTYLFDFIDLGTAGLINNEIRRAITFSEPRVELIDITVEPQEDQNSFYCRIEYKIVGYERLYTVEQILTPTR